MKKWLTCGKKTNSEIVMFCTGTAPDQKPKFKGFGLNQFGTTKSLGKKMFSNKTLDKKKYTFGSSSHLLKAFDTMDHNIIQSKSVHYCIWDFAFDWFQFVSFNGYNSCTIKCFLVVCLKALFLVPYCFYILMISFTSITI